MTRRARPGFVIVAVLVIMACALLIVTGLLFLVQADLAGADHDRTRVQGRALAWSGVQAIAAQLDLERDAILDGRVPRLDESYVLFESPSAVGIARLLPLGPDGARLVAEAGRLDLNSIDAPALERTGLVEAPVAEAIIAYRDGARGGAFRSVSELLLVDGVTPELLFGPLEDITPTDEAQGVDEGVGERIANRLVGVQPRGLADVVTVYSVEPELQRSGLRRMRLAVDWSPELGDRLEERFGADVRQALARVLGNGRSIDDSAQLIAALRDGGVAAEAWPEVVDAFTGSPDGYAYGRLDINTASTVALACLPGLDETMAEAIEQLRDTLANDDAASIAWPAIEAIIAPEAYDDLAPRITTRSWIYRVRIAAGLEDPEDPEGPLVAPVIVEAVIDLCDPAPRIAYLREITHLQATAMLAANATFDEADDGERDRARDDDDVATAGASEPGAIEGDDALDAETADDDGAPSSEGSSFELEETSMVEFPGFDDPSPVMPPEGAPEGDSAPSSDGAPYRPRRARVGRWHGG